MNQTYFTWVPEYRRLNLTSQRNRFGFVYCLFPIHADGIKFHLRVGHCQEIWKFPFSLFWRWNESNYSSLLVDSSLFLEICMIVYSSLLTLTVYVELSPTTGKTTRSVIPKSTDVNKLDILVIIIYLKVPIGGDIRLAKITGILNL